MSYRSTSGRYVLWRAIMERSRWRPDVWWMPLPNSSTSLIATIRQRRSPELRRADGALEAEGRNFYTDQMGVRRCDIYVKWRAAAPDASRSGAAAEGTSHDPKRKDRP